MEDSSADTTTTTCNYCPKDTIALVCKCNGHYMCLECVAKHVQMSEVDDHNFVKIVSSSKVEVI
jgi:hypothetical protein